MRLALMPKFYFHLHNDVDVMDEEGRELHDLEAARKWARHEARNMAGEMAKEEGRLVLHHRIDIAGADGKVLESVSFGEAVQVER